MPLESPSTQVAAPPFAPAVVAKKTPQVVVLIACHNNRAHLDDCLSSLLASDDCGLDRRVVVIDDASTDGSGAYVQECYPSVHCLRLEPPNRGFAGANNRGWAYVQRAFPEADFLVLLNVDTVVESGWLKPLADDLGEHLAVGCVQAKLRLHPEGDKLNTAGNRSHFLGFGFMVGYGEPDRGQHDRQLSIDFASAAALMVRTELLRRVGLFDEELYMYLEDQELSWKLRQIGYDARLVPASIVYHKYVADAPHKYYFELERNRWILLLTYYRVTTLALLAPALLVMELGQLAYAAGNGLILDKLRSWGYFLKPENLLWLWRRRRAAQARRTVGDRQCVARFAGTIHSEALRHPLLTYVGNPLLSLYWSIARRLIVW